MKRRLSPDELRDVFTKCTAKDDTWQEADLLKDHVEALEAEIVRLKNALRGATEMSMWAHARADHAGAKPVDQMMAADFEAMAEKRR